MSSVRFDTNTRVGPRSFVLEGSRIRMTGKAPFKTLQVDVDLSDIAPHFERQRFVAFRFIRNSIMCAGASVLLALVILRFTAVPSLIVIGGGGLLVVAFIKQIVTWSQPIDVAIYRTHAGVTVFEIWREKGFEQGFDHFAAALNAAILASQQLAQGNRRPTPADTPPMPAAVIADRSAAPLAHP